MRKRPIVTAALLAVTVAALTACSGGGSTPKNTAAPSMQVVTMSGAPAALQAKGTITFGTNASWAPMEYLDDKTHDIVGLDIDLADSVAGKLGLKAQFVNAPFDSLIEGIKNTKYDAGISSFTITNERLQTVNMVSYGTAGILWAAPAGKKVDPANICGLKVAVQKGTTEVEDTQSISDKCVKDGKKAIAIQQYPEQTAATTATVNGRADLMSADSPVTGYAIKQSGGKLVQVGEAYQGAPLGIVTAKDDTELATAMQNAMNELIKDGTYGQILEKWGATSLKVDQAELNPKQ